MPIFLNICLLEKPKRNRYITMVDKFLFGLDYKKTTKVV